MCSLPTTEFVEHIQSTTYQQYTHQTSISEQSHWNVKPNRNAAESPRPVKFWIQFSQAKKKQNSWGSDGGMDAWKGYLKSKEILNLQSGAQPYFTITLCTILFILKFGSISTSKYIIDYNQWIWIQNDSLPFIHYSNTSHTQLQFPAHRSVSEIKVGIT